jgi:hypothetical protein
MDEAGWLSAKYAGGMIWTLFSRSGKGGQIKDERFRRFGIACTRRALAALPGGNSPALDLVEASISSNLAAVLPNARKLHQAQLMAARGAERPFGQLAFACAVGAIGKCLKSKPSQAAVADEPAREAIAAMQGHTEGWDPVGYPRQPRHQAVVDAECLVQAALARDIFGNPFRPPVAFEPSWRTSTVLALAKQMYESGEFGAMPILADALQDAGCEDEAILDHCRDANQPHVRGCWVVDLVLSKS